ncbi:hypothetical protein [Aureimonas pseudogalii]|uniref:DUF2125 domain-containing protein n=1 Tax=Aureimonas pseudogalii TaxID=1744844 RepID=A0A7W6ML98_9HYPH|nr:hypothetical protein [Aureimonas pseudogalii]MBB3999550.1 hypothetical protein [Aureimonas pseudogalii]
MHHRFKASALALWLAWLPAGPVLAQDGSMQPAPASAGTIEEAASLQTALTAYLTGVPFEKKLLRIEPDPHGHRIVLDPAAVLSDLAGTPVSFAPLSLVVSERDDGTWNVFTRDPVVVSGAFDVEGQTQRFEYSQGSQLFKGVYSPALATFLSAEAQVGTTTNRSNDAVSDSVATIGATRLTVAATPAADGGADVAFTQVYDAVSQTTTVRFPVEEGAPPSSFGFEMGAKGVETRGSLKAARTRPILDLYALVLSNAADLERDAKGTLAGPFGMALKDRLRSVLPLWSSLDGTASARDVKVASLYGEFGIGEASQTVHLSGIAADASFDMDVALRGLAVTTPMMPAWGASLTPDLVELGVAVSGVDLATPLEMALEKADFASDPPLTPQVQADVQAAFAPERIRVRIKPSRIRSRDLDVAFSGEVSLASGLPVSTMAIDVGGLDTAIATLQGAAASDPNLHQAVGMLQFAKGLSRPKDGGRLEWVVVSAGDGSVAINGTMLKGPDEPPALETPDGETPGDEMPAVEVPADEL